MAIIIMALDMAKLSMGLALLHLSHQTEELVIGIYCVPPLTPISTIW